MNCVEGAERSKDIRFPKIWKSRGEGNFLYNLYGKTPSMAAIDTTLLSTKLYLPALHAPLVARRQLLLRLQEGLNQSRRLTLISAPAGYGKTLLVVEWIRHQALKAAWVSLDEGDNDFVRFARYLIAALRSLHPELGEASLQLLKNAQLPSVEGLLTPLVNELAGLRESHPLLLVLDDYHLIHSQAVHDAAIFLVEYLPRQAHLVLITRADPPLPLARWRGRGQLSELRMDDLRFSTAETAAYLEMVLKLRLSNAELEALVARSEGWIAGLQMAAASLHERSDIAVLMQAISGSQRNILDYLLEEVLQHLPAETQDFLVRSSFLERLCGPLCDAVLERQGTSQALLESLERANLFTIPLDDQRTWYRYHHLFADLLQTRLYQRVDASGLTALRLQASQWHAEHGLLPAAVELAFQASDFERAAALIEQSAEEMLRRGELVTFKRWIERLPAAQITARPTLCLYQAWALLWSGSPFDLIAASLQPLKDVDLHTARMLPLQAYLALIQGDATTAIQQANLALEQLPTHETFLRAMATMVLASAAQITDDADRGQQLHDQVIQDGLSSGNLLLSITMLSSLANLLQKEGRLGLAEEKYRQALELAVDAQGRYLPVASRPLLGLVSIALERDQLEGIEAQLLQSVELSQSWGAIALVNSNILLSRVQSVLGKLSAAQESLNRARRQARQFDLTEMDDLSVEIFQARLNLQQNDLAAVRAWAEKRDLWGIEPQEGLLVSDFTNAHMRKYEYPILARLYLADAQPTQALALLDAVLPHDRLARRPALVIEAQILRALVLQTLGRIPEAHATLEEALTLAEPEGYVRLFLDEGPPMKAVLGQVIPGMGISHLASFARALLGRFASSGTSAVPAIALPEPLSVREMEVLRLLVETSMSAEQVAETLFVSVHTVRSHIKAIYSKLGVHGRLEAASRAKDMKLV